MLNGLKEVMELRDFKESQKWQRVYAKHFFSLLKKMDRTEFRARLLTIKNDSFKCKNINSIKYLYGEIKSVNIKATGRGIKIC